MGGYRMMAVLAGAVLALVWGLSRGAAVADSGGEVTVTVTGESAHSYEEAKEDALRRAVEMGAGKEIFADTRVADFTLRHDTIVSRAAGYVRSYDVLEKKEVQGVYTVRVQAVVALGKIRDDWGAVHVLIQRKGRPNLLIVCSEEVIWAVTGRPLPGTGNVAEYRLRELFGEKGFDLIDDETLNQAIGRQVTRAMLVDDPARAAALGQQLHAGYVVLIKANARAQPPGDVYGLRLAVVDTSLDIKAVAADNAQLLASKSVTASRSSEDPTTAARQGFELGAAEISPELLRRILTKWSEEIDVGTKIECVGTRIPTAIHDRLVEALRATDGVKTVSTVDHNEQLSTDSVVTRLEPKAIGQILAEAGRGRIEVTGYSPGRIEYRMRPGAEGAAVAVAPTGAASDEVPLSPAPSSQPPAASGGAEPVGGGLPPYWPAVAVSAAAVVAAFLVGLLIARRRANRAPRGNP
jgi:hypothetical protein